MAHQITVEQGLAIVQLLIPAIQQAVAGGQSTITLADVQSSADQLGTDLAALDALIALKSGQAPPQ